MKEYTMNVATHPSADVQSTAAYQALARGRGRPRPVSSTRKRVRWLAPASCALMLTLIVGPALGRSYYGQGLDDLNNVKTAEEEAKINASARSCSEYQMAHHTDACSKAQEDARKKRKHPPHIDEIFD